MNAPLLALAGRFSIFARQPDLSFTFCCLSFRQVKAQILNKRTIKSAFSDSLRETKGNTLQQGDCFKSQIRVYAWGRQKYTHLDQLNTHRPILLNFIRTKFRIRCRNKVGCLIYCHLNEIKTCVFITMRIANERRFNACLSDSQGSAQHKQKTLKFFQSFNKSKIDSSRSSYCCISYTINGDFQTRTTSMCSLKLTFH